MGFLELPADVLYRILSFTHCAEWRAMQSSSPAVHRKLCPASPFPTFAAEGWRISDAFLDCMAPHLQVCTVLELPGCSSIEADRLVRLAAQCPKLQRLNLSRCGVSNAELVQLCKACPGLTDLDLSGCNQISDAGVGMMGSYLGPLANLDISGCNVSFGIIHTVALQCMNLVCDMSPVEDEICYADCYGSW